MAETARAKHVPIHQLEAGMKVHRNVMGRGGKTLVSSGEILTKTHVDKLKSWEGREKPIGPALPKKDPKDRSEAIRHGEFQGGWRPSHFNEHGVLVSATLASGQEFPEVEKDPSKSKFYQEAEKGTKATTAVPSTTIFDAIETEIKTLESTNAQLGGNIHTLDVQPEVMGDMETRRDELVNDNQRLVDELRDGSKGGRVSPHKKPKRRK